MDTQSQDRAVAAGDSGSAPCVACGGELAFFGKREGYEYHRCLACGTLQLVPMPTQAALEEAYAKTYASSGHMEVDPIRNGIERRTCFEFVVAALEEHGAAGRVFEAGAGWGGIAEMLSARGFQYEGIEPNEQMAAHCRSKGLPVTCASFADWSGSGFDAVVMNAVFEHTPDPEAWLDRIRNGLRPGGLFVTLQPTARFPTLLARLCRLGSTRPALPRLHQVLCPPWHTALFSLGGMETLARPFGLELIEVRPAPQARAGGVTGFIQVTLELVNRVGWRLAGTRWPLLIGHLFVFQKTG